jgi:TPR repeat protein
MPAGRRAALLGLFASAIQRGPAAAADAAAAGSSENNVDAMRIWRGLAEQGDPQAALRLGELYDFGRGVPRNAASAMRYYLLAAQAGLADAEFNVAALYDNGVGVARDAALAALWYARAASHGHARACFDLGQLYAAGDGVPRNPAMAACWYRVAGAAGLIAAGPRVAGLLQSAARAEAAQDGGALAPAMLAAPVDAALPALRAELVWLAPPQPSAVRYFVQVIGLAGGAPNQVFGGFTDTSALLTSLPAAGRFAWRVYSTAAARASYAASPWARFTASAP